MTGPAIRVIVVDDDNLFRQGLVEILRLVDDFEVVGEGGSGGAALKLATELRPDVALLDVQMPGPTPAETIRKLREASPGTGVVVVTVADDPDLIYRLIQAGACGYLMKSADRRDLATAVHAAAKATDLVNVLISRKAFLRLRVSVSRPPSQLLTARELEVLAALAQAKSTTEIATTLGIAELTVKKHLANIYAKLEVTNRVEALLTAQQRGLVATTHT
ncbi:MAG: response regulator transcription factor [Actinomycetia bacterium]|nr:response regulator transcription factor [Actinomycetes bacterium]